MLNIVNSCLEAENWMWIGGGIAGFLFVIPTLFWGIAPGVVAIICYDDMEETLDYRRYWGDIVRQEGFSHIGHGMWGNLWRFWLSNKTVRIMNILSYMFVWGYLLLLLGYAIGWLIRLIWRALKALGRGIAKLYRAI